MPEYHMDHCDLCGEYARGDNLGYVDGLRLFCWLCDKLDDKEW